MANISTWSTTAASNNSASPDGFPEGMAPSGVNNSAREVMAAVRTWYEAAEWVDLGDTPTFVDTDTFTISGDVTTAYHVNRRIKITDSSTLYGRISASSYSAPDTTIDVTLDSGSITASISAVALGINSAVNPSLGTAASVDTGTGSGNVPLVGTTSATDTLAGLIETATQAEQETGTATDKAVTSGRQHYHPAHPKVVAVVTYSGGTPSLNAANSHGVSSIVDDGVGLLTINFSTNFTDANFGVAVTAEGTATVSLATVPSGGKAVGSVQVAFYNPYAASITLADPTSATIVCCGDT